MRSRHHDGVIRRNPQTIVIPLRYFLHGLRRIPKGQATRQNSIRILGRESNMHMRIVDHQNPHADRSFRKTNPHGPSYSVFAKNGGTLQNRRPYRLVSSYTKFNPERRSLAFPKTLNKCLKILFFQRVFCIPSCSAVARMHSRAPDTILMASLKMVSEPCRRRTPSKGKTDKSIPLPF